MAPPPPDEILAAYGLLGWQLDPITTGLINRTFLAHMGDRRRVLQRVNPIFGPEVNEDIDAVTSHLAARGMETPRLVRSRSGAPCITDGDGGVWRVLTHVAGETVERVDAPPRARAAGELLGRFHRALRDLDHRFKSRRVGVHDTPAHLANLAAALGEHLDHPAHGEVAPVAREILARAQGLPALPAAPLRVVHGDPKISNVIFGEDGQARCLVDLDTLARMALHLELGDALRSWCNPAGEEAPGRLDADLAAAALEGYAAGAPRPSTAELAALPFAAGHIALELSARFCADALQERYFGWAPARFPTASAHNLVRARSQLALAADALQAAPWLARLVARLWP